MKNHLTQIFVGSIMLIIIVFYYRTELEPFEYENFDMAITRIQQYDAELEEGIVQTRFGLMKHYDAINEAITGLNTMIAQLNEQLQTHPHDAISPKIDKLEETLTTKVNLTQKFKRLNPVLRNAIHDFSNLMGKILEDEAHTRLIESLSLGDQYEANERTALIEDVNTLYRGILVYTSFPSAEQREKMLALIQEIKSSAQTLDDLDRALVFGEMVLNKQPELNALNIDIIEVPVLRDLEALHDEYRNSYEEYNARLGQSRLFLYGLSILLLVVLHFAFKRLQDTVKRLQVEINLKNTAQNELAQINAELEQRVEDRTRDLARKNDDLNKALGELEDAQDQLIMQEKMASVGMLTTGVAHEIKNPLNFINNFSDISIDLVDELKEEFETQKDKLAQESSSYVDEILNDLKTNCEKISEHGKRADNIVKNMLLHSQSSGVQKEMVKINQLVEDNINITLQSAKSQNEHFEVKVEKNFKDNLNEILIAPQAIGRVLAYLLNNAFYAVEDKKKTKADFSPFVKVNVQQDNDYTIIKVWDNGTGIAQEHLKKIFDPFYTTKPTGRGNTGLGLSICYDTVVKQHKGDLSVKSEVGEFTEMTIKLPNVKSQALSNK